MISFPAKAKTGADGLLSLEVFTGMPNADLDVLVVVESAHRRNSVDSLGARWPTGYFDLFGSLGDMGFERPSQGELQDRLPLTPILP